MQFFKRVIELVRLTFARWKLRREIDKLEGLHLKAYLAAAASRERYEESGLAWNKSTLARIWHFHRRNATSMEKELNAKRGLLRAMTV